MKVHRWSSYWAVGNTLNFGTGITADMLTPRFDSATQIVTLDLGNGDSFNSVRAANDVGGRLAA